MVVNTSGIVFHHLKYSESSIIAKIYTERFGLQSFLVKGVRQKKSRMRMNLFGPLSLVDLVMDYKEKSTLHHLRDISSSYPFTGITTDITRTSLAIFINELLYKSIQGEEPDQALFDYIVKAIKYLDSATGRLVSFHLYLAMTIIRLLSAISICRKGHSFLPYHHTRISLMKHSQDTGTNYLPDQLLSQPQPNGVQPCAIHCSIKYWITTGFTFPNSGK